jgi:hypothetical protein
MPQHQHCPPARRRGDRNPKYHMRKGAHMKKGKLKEERELI